MLNRRILIALALSFLTVFLLQYFTGSKREAGGPEGAASKGKIKSGQFYSAPVQQAWYKKPNLEVDFVDKKIDKNKEKRVTIKTPLSIVTFSNFGGILQSFSFKKHKSKTGRPLNTIETDTINEREDGCFLLALGEKTPFLYDLISQKKEKNLHEIVYQTKSDDWIIRKTYTIYDDNYKIDLKFDFEPTKDNPKPINPRLFIATPYVEEIADNNINGFVTYDGISVVAIDRSKELGGVWGLPEIFGGSDKYFAHGLIADKQHFSQGGFFKRVNKKMFTIIDGPDLKTKKSYPMSFYIGPKLLKDLSIVDPRLEDLLALGWLSFLCKWLLQLLEFLYKHIGNFGVAIVVLTVLLKLPFLPLSISSRRKMEEYQKYQPTIQRIRAKYKTDLQTQQREIMRFHQEHNISPATPIIGCLPLLIQLPILFALYRVLSSYLALYQAPFFGWITDLSAKDPYYILPILMGATMIWQQTMSPIKDQKQKMMMMFMPIIMTVIFFNFPAGLVLYWFVNNFLTVGEDLLRKKFFA